MGSDRRPPYKVADIQLAGLGRKRALAASWRAETARLVDHYRLAIVRSRIRSKLRKLGRMLFA